MGDIGTVVKKRINALDLDILCNTIEKLNKYNVQFYNNKGHFDFNSFRTNCIDTSEYLYENDTPINGIRYQFCDLLSAIQVIVGIRNFSEFMTKSN